RAEGPRPRSAGAAFFESAHDRLAGRVVRAAPLLAVLLRLGAVHVPRLCAGPRMGVTRQRMATLGGGGGGAVAVVGAPRGAPRPGGSAGGRRRRGRIATGA